MRITIIGAGAMGCLFAVLLADQEDVRLIDRSPEVVAAINEHGLRLLDAHGERIVHVPIATDPGQVAGSDVALILVKAAGTSWAGAMAQAVLAPGGLALTLQNGLGQREALVGILGTARVWQGVTAQGATWLGPGHVRHTGHGPTHLETRPCLAERANAVADVLRKAGLDVFLLPESGEHDLGKLLVNVGINALSGLLRVSNGVLAETPAVRQIMAQAVAEAVQVARAKRDRVARRRSRGQGPGSVPGDRGEPLVPSARCIARAPDRDRRDQRRYRA